MSETMEHWRRGLEEAFFAEHNAMLRQRLIEADQARARQAALAGASGITDEAVLQRLLRLGIGAETLAALALAPLALVAWADGMLDERERLAVLQAAAETGAAQSGPARDLLEGWLKQRPPAALLDAWLAYVRAMQEGMAEEQRDELKTQLLGRARRVAEATGGLLGLGWTVSSSEAAMLARLEAAFAA